MYGKLLAAVSGTLFVDADARMRSHAVHATDVTSVQVQASSGRATTQETRQ